MVTVGVNFLVLTVKAFRYSKHFFHGRCKAIPLQAWTGQEGSRRLRLPDFKTIGTWRWQDYQPYAPATFTPRKYSWYSFLLEAESTPWPKCGQKDYINEKFKWHHRKLQPSDLQCSASTNSATACPLQGRCAHFVTVLMFSNQSISWLKYPYISLKPFFILSKVLYP